MTLLERWDSDDKTPLLCHEEIRRAIAIAQAVEEWNSLARRVLRPDEVGLLAAIKVRADELLEGK